MRKYYWYLSAFIRKHGLVLLVSIVGAMVFFSLFIPFIARAISPKPRYYIGMVGSYNLQTMPREIQNLISAGLTKLETDGTVSPALSQRWSVEDDGQTYRFIVNEDLVWQDGKPLVPEDISYNFNDVETITTANDIVFKLPDVYVPFPVIVSQPIFRTVKEPYLFFFERERVIGLGTYDVLSLEWQGQRIREITVDGPHDRRTYRFYLTEDDAIEAFKHGEVDYLAELTNPDELLTWETVEIREEFHPERYMAVFFDLNKPIFAKNIRQALAYALPKPEGDLRAIGPINPNSWAYLEGGKDYEYDYERAVERMLSAVPEQPLTFELTTSPNFETFAEDIKVHWENFGEQVYQECQSSKDVSDKEKCENVKITIAIRITNFPDTANFDALLIAQESPPDPDQYYLWHSEQPTNFSHYKNTRIDSLLERGRQVIDRQERKEIYQEFQQFMLEDSPAIFLQHLVSFDVERS